jgi:hypothetical protein
VELSLHRSGLDSSQLNAEARMFMEFLTSPIPQAVAYPRFSTGSKPL